MKISVIIPVYNEEKTIRELLDKVLSVKISKDIIVVNDGSTDGTGKILKTFSKKIKLINHKSNLGKGAAIKSALKKVSNDIVIIQDADLEYDPAEYPKLIEPILNGKAEVVYGSRLRKNHYSISYWTFFLGGLYISGLVNVLYNQRISDESTGYKVFKTEILKNIKLECQGFDFCPEVTAKISKLGIKIFEVPISYIPRHFSEGKKISWRDGLIAIWTLIRYRFINQDEE